MSVEGCERIQISSEKEEKEKEWKRPERMFKEDTRSSFFFRTDDEMPASITYIGPLSAILVSNARFVTLDGSAFKRPVTCN